MAKDGQKPRRPRDAEFVVTIMFLLQACMCDLIDQKPFSEQVALMAIHAGANMLGIETPVQHVMAWVDQHGGSVAAHILHEGAATKIVEMNLPVGTWTKMLATDN